MEPTQFFASSRLVIVAGKGGVGKTTVSAALSRAAAITGLDTLIVEVEGKSGLPELFDHRSLNYEETTMVEGTDGEGTVRARTLTADDALIEFLRGNGLNRVSKRLVNSGALDMVATAAPGIGDLLILGKVKQLERAKAADLLVLDAPAAGHAITFLRSPRGLHEAVRVGPIHSQAADALKLLADPSRCSVTLVTLPEETPVNELIETAYSLEEDIGVSLGPVVINGVYPSMSGLDTDPLEAAVAAGASLRPGEADQLRAAADFRLHRIELQQQQIARLADELPLPQIQLPHLFTSELGPTHVDQLAASLLDSVRALSEAVLT